MKNDRYIRQTLLKEIGHQGQDRLNAAHIAIVGCGGLGSIAAPYLAGAGVGKISLIDGDNTDVSNLHRQVFYTEASEGESKANLLAKHVESLNSDIEIIIYHEMLTKNNIHEILQGADLVLECTDTIFTKYLVNDYCALYNIPMVYGAIHKFDGYVSLFENSSKKSIHLRDIFPEPDTTIPSCSEVGVMGPLAGLTGLFQANEAIKFLTKSGDNLIGRLLTYNVLTNEQMTLKLKKCFHKDMEHVFSMSPYSEKNCALEGITKEHLIQHRKDYVVISVLEKDENISFDEETINMPMSSFDFDSWKPDPAKSYVFHCKSGKRSQAVLTQLKESKKNGSFYYLIQS